MAANLNDWSCCADGGIRNGAEEHGPCARIVLLPLPLGEGWGECAVWVVSPCRGLAAQHLRRFSVWPRESIALTPGPSPGGRGEKKVLVLES